MASENGLLAIKVGGRGDMTATNVLWKYHKSVPQLPSPLLYRNVLYMVNDGGIVTTLKPDTGDAIAQGRLKGAIDRFYASPVAADGKVFMASETGKVVVLPTDGSLEPVAVNDLRRRHLRDAGDCRRPDLRADAEHALLLRADALDVSEGHSRDE